MDTRRGLGVIALVIGIGLIVAGGAQLTAPGAPGASPTPTTQPSANTTPGPSATTAPTPGQTSSPTPSPSPSPTPDLKARAAALYTQLVPAIRSADVETLLERLHPATLERYGEAACRTYFESLDDPTFDIVVDSVGPIGSWDYVTDERSTTIADAWTVEVQFTSQGQTAARSLHIALVDGELRWFTDCGTPLAP